MGLLRSNLFPDPNPLAQPSETRHPMLKLIDPPQVNSNPLSVAQHNGFVDGARLGGTTGFVLGVGAGLLTFYLLRRYA